MSRTRAFAIVSFAAALVLGYLAWEWYLSPEARVRRTLGAAADAAERLDADELLSLFAEDYADFAHADRASLDARVREGFSRIDRFNVTLRSLDVTVEGNEATARFDLVVVAVRGEERYVVLGTPFEGEKIESNLRRADGGWRVFRVSRGGSP